MLGNCATLENLKTNHCTQGINIKIIQFLKRSYYQFPCQTKTLGYQLTPKKFGITYLLYIRVGYQVWPWELLNIGTTHVGFTVKVYFEENNNIILYMLL